MIFSSVNFNVEPHRRKNSHRSMSYSLNWKALSSKLKKTSLKNKVSKKNGVKKTIKLQKEKDLKIHKKEKGLKPQDNPHAKLLSPLEFALWSNDGEIDESKIPQESKVLIISPESKKDQRKMGPGKYLAMDCEFVGVGPEGRESVLARVSIVNFYGHVILDTFVKPSEVVTDWRTWVSGVSASDMKDAITFKEAQEKVAEILDHKILVGHAIHKDLDVLFLSHPRMSTRDTSKYKVFKEIAKGKAPALKKLVEQFLKISIQNGSHSSVEDARATMLLFRVHKNGIEQALGV